MERRNDYDVTNQVNTTNPSSVSTEVNRIFLELYPNSSTHVLNRSFRDLARLHKGEYPGYRACDTGYHNLQHSLDVTLAMARLMDGYERTHDSHRTEAIGAKLFRFGVVTALFHDVGYLRKDNDMRHKNGAEYTLKHVTRGAKFRDRLYPEFVEGGLAARDDADHRAGVMFQSAEDLVTKTPNFYKTATVRLNDHLGSAYGYADKHFGGQNLYLDEITKNIDYAVEVAEQRDLSLLRRAPPHSSEDGVDVSN
jgi:hypothetical protein